MKTNDNYVISENEIACASKKIASYIEYLEDVISKYISIVNSVKNEGIQDKVICKKLSMMINAVEPAIKSLDNIRSDIQGNLYRYVNETRQADSFEFPDDIDGSIKSVLSKFLD